MGLDIDSIRFKKRLNVRMTDKFDGYNTSARNHLERFEWVANCNEWGDTKKVKEFNTLLKSSARHWVNVIFANNPTIEWNQLRDMFLFTYDADFRNQMILNIRNRNNATACRIFQDFYSLYEGVFRSTEERLLVLHLTNRIAVDIIMNVNFSDLKDLETELYKLRSSKIETNKQPVRFPVFIRFNLELVERLEQFARIIDDIKAFDRQVQSSIRIEENRENADRKVSETNTAKDKGKKRKVCFKCKQPGHYVNVCPNSEFSEPESVYSIDEIDEISSLVEKTKLKIPDFMMPD